METLEEKVQGLIKTRASLQKDIDLVDHLIKYFKSLKEITRPNLYLKLGKISELKSIKNKDFTLNIYEGNYKYILGGDGRSQPWDETRVGVICDIETPYYLNAEDEKIVMNYLKGLGKIDKFKINGV